MKELRGFLGLTGYYQRFIQRYGMISKPLTNLLKKNSFQSGVQVDNAFASPKKAMTKAPILALPDFSREFILEMNACDSGVGAILIQEGRPIAYLSQALDPRHIG